MALEDQEPARVRLRSSGSFGIGVGVGVAGVLIVALIAAGLFVAHAAVGGGGPSGLAQAGAAGANGSWGASGRPEDASPEGPDVNYGSASGAPGASGVTKKPDSSGGSYTPAARQSPTRQPSALQTHTPSPTVKPTAFPTPVPTPVPPSYIGYVTLEVSHYCYSLASHAIVGPYAVGTRWGVFGVIYANGAWSWEVAPPELNGVHCASGMNGDTHFDSNKSGVIGTIVLHASHWIYRMDTKTVVGPYPVGTTWTVYGTGTSLENTVQSWLIYPPELGGGIECAEGELGDIEFIPA